LEKYSTAVLDCALDDRSPESSLVVAQILRKNKALLFESSGKLMYPSSDLLIKFYCFTAKCTANSFCAAIIALQMSSPRATEILLQLFPAMTGHTKSRAMEALATCFSRTTVKSEVSLARLLFPLSNRNLFQLKLATLLFWAFGDSFFDQWSTDGAPNSEDSVKSYIF
jgi:hypothetical protein